MKSNRFGYINPDGSVRGDYATWYDMIKALADEMVEKFTRHNLLEAEYIKRFGDFYVAHKDVFALDKEGYDGRPTLVHNDLWSPNILVSNKSGEWKIAAIIDAYRALFGDYEYEFALWRGNPDFMEGYRTPLDMSEAGIIKRLGYKMILGVLNTYVSMVELNDPAEYEFEKERLVDSIKQSPEV